MKTAEELQKELDAAQAALESGKKERDTLQARLDAAENPPEINLTVPADAVDFFAAHKEGVNQIMGAVEQEATEYGISPENAQRLFEERLDLFERNVEDHAKGVEQARASGIELMFGSGKDGESAYQSAVVKFVEGVDEKDMAKFVESGRVPKDTKLTSDNVGQFFAPAEITAFLGKAGLLGAKGASASVPTGAGNPPPSPGNDPKLGAEFSFTVKTKSGETRTLTLDPNKPEDARKILNTPIPGGTKVLGDLQHSEIQRARKAYFDARAKM